MVLNKLILKVNLGAHSLGHKLSHDCVPHVVTHTVVCAILFQVQDSHGLKHDMRNDHASQVGYMGQDTVMCPFFECPHSLSMSHGRLTPVSQVFKFFSSFFILFNLILKCSKIIFRAPKAFLRPKCICFLYLLCDIQNCSYVKLLISIKVNYLKKTS